MRFWATQAETGNQSNKMKSRFRVVTEVDESGTISIPTGVSEPVPHIPPHLSDRWSLIGGTVGCILLAGFLAFFADLNVSWGLNQQHLLKPIHRTLELAEPFGDFAGVLLVAVGIAVLQPAARKQIHLLVLAVATAGLTADIFKTLVGRIRPNNLDWSLVHNVGDTFTGWLPLIHGGWKNQSFPSAHTATAWGLAILMVRLFPRGKWFFPCVAVCVGLQRVETGSHYLSDALFGAAIGIGISCAWLKSPLFRDFLPVNSIDLREDESEQVSRTDRDRLGESSAG